VRSFSTHVDKDREQSRFACQLHAITEVEAHSTSAPTDLTNPPRASLCHGGAGACSWFLCGETMLKAALVVAACVVAVYFGMGTAQTGAQTIKSSNARVAAIEAAAL